MNYQRLLSEAQYTTLNGNILSPQEKAALQSSLVLLKKQQKANNVNYWGKIQGINNDYHVAQAFNNAFDDKVTCYSVDGGITWLNVPDIQDDEYQYCAQIRGYFTGDPAYTYTFEGPKEEGEEEVAKVEEKGEDEEEEAIEEEEGEEGANDAKKNANLVQIVESTRLAFVIASIDQDTAVVPRGSYILQPEGSVVPNQTFQGLSDYAAGKLESFVHLRQPVRLPLKSALERDALDKTLDFCDTLDEDVPNKCWSLQYNNVNQVVVGKSLLWPGYVFYAMPNAPTFGAFYIGSGCKNYDLCFMTRGTTSVPVDDDE
mmetsp:Transcript_11802/g.17526  ORF Transcript_11802/g.17526 Transcript_11802/m.17526 type:complete len:315 (-) Transcript_11802:2801-3745(-)